MFAAAQIEEKISRFGPAPVGVQEELAPPASTMRMTGRKPSKKARKNKEQKAGGNRVLPV